MKTKNTADSGTESCRRVGDYMIFTFIAFGFTTSIAIGALFPCAFALLMYFKAEKAAAIIMIVLAVLNLWNIATIIVYAINWSAGFGFSYYFIQFTRVIVNTAYNLIIGIALLKRVKNSRSVSIVIVALGGAIGLYSLIYSIKMFIGGNMGSFGNGCIGLIGVAMQVLIILIVVGSLSVKDQTAAEGHNEAIPS